MKKITMLMFCVMLFAFILGVLLTAATMDIRISIDDNTLEAVKIATNESNSDYEVKYEILKAEVGAYNAGSEDAMRSCLEQTQTIVQSMSEYYLGNYYQMENEKQ